MAFSSFNLSQSLPRGGGGGGGGVLRISGDRNDRVGAKINPPQKKSRGLQTNPPKNCGPKLNPQKIPCQISVPKKFPESIHIRYNMKLDI